LNVRYTKNSAKGFTVHRNKALYEVYIHKYNRFMIHNSTTLVTSFLIGRHTGIHDY